MEQKTVTIADVAEALGVSKTTVSRAISGKGRLSEETRRRVLDYIAQCDYKPSVIARGLAQSKTFNICVVMPEDYHLSDLPFFHKAIVGIQEIAGKRDYDILLCTEREDDCSNLERILVNRKVDGVILLRTYIQDRQIALLKEKNVPFVAVGSTDCEGVYQVDHDQERACRELTELVLARERLTRMALLGGRDSLVITKNRKLGFLNAFRKLGVQPQKELIYENLETRQTVEDAVADALQKKADGLICMDDVICSQVLQKLHRDGVRIPQDVRVVSFYNSWVLETHVPAITALSFDAKELGREACRMMFDVLDGKPVEQRRLLRYTILN